jgi:hypothetical protein
LPGPCAAGTSSGGRCTATHRHSEWPCGTKDGGQGSSRASTRSPPKAQVARWAAAIKRSRPASSPSRVAAHIGYQELSPIGSLPALISRSPRRASNPSGLTPIYAKRYGTPHRAVPPRSVIPAVLAPGSEIEFVLGREHRNPAIAAWLNPSWSGWSCGLLCVPRHRRPEQDSLIP